jgi:hypothetical protein
MVGERGCRRREGRDDGQGEACHFAGALQSNATVCGRA